ncbi:Uncharacterized protein dnm_045310 [Desulfonema magnum]|uniref:Uncharacterized protein n=1 Tax=Desulfonema magnum TaxID=45655 RepID=A0A975GP54_9BACT|nr:Uncharacterized protein dnm_045310 [Desulfonema magnum]
MYGKIFREIILRSRAKRENEIAKVFIIRIYQVDLRSVI